MKIKVYTMKLNFSKIQSIQFADGPVVVNQKMAVFEFKFGNLGNQISFLG